MSVILVACRYGAVLYEVGRDDKKIYDEALALIELFSSRTNAISILQSIEKERFKEFCSSFSEVMGNFLMLVRHKHRLSNILPILKSFVEIYEQNSGVTSFELRTGSVVDGATIDRIAQIIAKKIGKKVAIKSIIDQNIVGGFTATSRSLHVDATFTGSLHAIHRDMLLSLQSIEV